MEIHIFVFDYGSIVHDTGSYECHDGFYAVKLYRLCFKRQFYQICGNLGYLCDIHSDHDWHRYFTKSYQANVYQKNNGIFKKRYFQHILKKDIRSFSDENSAKYISILTNDIGMIETDYIENIFNLIWQVTTFVLAMLSVVYINYKLAIAVFVMGIIGFYLPQRFRNMLSKRKEISSSSLEILTAKTKDLLSGFEVIHNFNIAWKATELYDDINQDVELKKQKFSVTSGVINTLTNFLGTCMFILPMLVGGYFVYLGLITVGSLVALIQLMNKLAGPLSQSLQIMNQMRCQSGSKALF